jgi:hypothetical protein
VKPEDLVANNPFHEIERSPPQDQLARERLGGGDRVASIGGTPQRQDADQGNDLGQCMKEAVPRHIDPHGIHRVRRDDVREHVMPWRNLVQRDAIDAPAHADAEENTCHGGAMASACFSHTEPPAGDTF